MKDDFSIAKKPLMEIRDLKVHFPVKTGLVFRTNKNVVRAVDGVSLNIRRGETLGLVGESGCGKSTTGLALLRLIVPTAGRVLFEGVDLSLLRPREMTGLRRRMQIVFQDPYSSLNPRMTVRQILAEPLVAHKMVDKGVLTDRILELMGLTGLDPMFSNRYPIQFSGGQRQRISIARALALNPDFVVADEPVSALDVSIQAQIINLLQNLQEKLSLTYLFISHDLSVVRYISDRVAVMYAGNLVELADEKDLFANPLHPYTRDLIAAVPIPDPLEEKKRKHIFLEGDVFSPTQEVQHCKFYGRCQVKNDLCKDSGIPELTEKRPNHWVACFNG